MPCVIPALFLVLAHIPLLHADDTTYHMARAHLSDFDFIFALWRRRTGYVTCCTWKEEVSGIDYPLLNWGDVEASVQRIVMRAGSSFPSHAHPRASENVYVEKGIVRAVVTFDGSLTKPARKIKNDLLRADALAIPQGLRHAFHCISKQGCEFVSFFNRGDPGWV